MDKQKRKAIRSLGIAAVLVSVFAVVLTAAANESRLTTDGDDQRYPAVSGNRVVWQDTRNDPGDIYALTLGGAEQRLTTHPGKDLRPRIDGTKVVFERYPEDAGPVPNPDIQLYDFATSQITTVSAGPNTEYGPDISGDKVVWYEFDAVSSRWDVKIKDLSNGQIYSVTTAAGDQIYPRISGRYVVWQDERAGQADIYYYDLAEDTDGDTIPNYKDPNRPVPDPAEKPLVTLASSQKNPDIEGSRIVWADDRNGNFDIYNYDLADPGAGETRLTADPKDQMVPAISGNRVVWTDWRNGNGLYNVNADIYTYNLTSGAEVRLTTNTSNQKNPAISGNKVVYEDNRNGYFDIYLYEIDEIPPTGSISIDGGALYSKSTSVTLSLPATDAVGVSQMRFSNDDAGWTAWETYAGAKNYALNPSDGTKSVYVQYRDAAGNVSTGTISDSIFLDTGVPVGPTVTTSTPTPNIWSSDNTVFVAFSGATDTAGSGVDGFSASFTQGATATPDDTLDLQESAVSTTSPPLANGTWYFNLRTKDNAGNWTATVHQGPFKIDRAAPVNPPAPAVEASGAISNVWQRTVADPNFTWSPGGDSTGSGIKGYYYYWGTVSNGTPSTWTPSPAFNPPAVPSPSTYYLRVKTEDNAGNQSDPVDLFTFKYDNNAPVDPAVTTSTPAPNIWSNDNTVFVAFSGATDTAGSGVDGFSVSFTQGATATPDTTFDLQESAVSTTSPPLADGTWYFNLRTRDNAGNWTSTVHQGPFKIDRAAPGNPPAPAVETSGAISNVWQRTVANPNFTWSPGGDSTGSGVKGYWYYWGTVATGTPSTWTPSPAFNPGAVPSPSTYYLRVKTEDNAGNQSAPVDLFTFRYDNDVPVNPLAPATETHDVPNNRWQNVENDPAFTWADGTDTGSGVQRYWYYWGASSTGTPSTETTLAAFDPPPVLNSSTNYLHVKTEDKAGNQSLPVTLFTFKYDSGRPSNPKSATETIGLLPSDTWQNAVPDPSFIWSPGSSSAEGSEVARYYYYLGPSSDGTSTDFTTETSYSPVLPVDNPSLNYLRVKTVDDIDNEAEWETLYVFKYDNQAPVDPVVTAAVPAANTWSNDNTVYVAFSGATDTIGLGVAGSGVDGYSVSFTPNTAATPDETRDMQESAVSTTSPPLADGAWYFNLRTKDNVGNWTATVNEGPFKIDTAAPTGGAISINSGAASANLSAVTLNLSAIDAGSGVAQVGLSNDGASWSWEPYAAAKSWTLSGGDGGKTVHVKFKDALGHESGVVSDNITLDTVAPAAWISAPALSTNVSKTKAFTVTWSGADPAPGTGVAVYDVQYRIGRSGTWTNWLAATAATSADFIGKPGKTYYFRVRARDGAGNTGAWSSAAKTIVPFDQNSKIVMRVGFAGTLSKVSSGHFLSTTRYSKSAGDEIRYTAAGDYFAFITFKGKGRGKAAIYVDGKLRKTVDTFAKSTKYRQVVYSIAFSKVGKHTLRIVNKGTAGRPLINLDGLAVGN